MLITKAELIALNACAGGIERFTEQTDGTAEPVEVSSLIGGKNTYGDLAWLASNKLPREKVLKFAKDVALINVELIKPYSKESDYQIIVDFLTTGENPDSANAAAKAANKAVYAANATPKAAFAANAAASASDCKNKINELLRELFEGVK